MNEVLFLQLYCLALKAVIVALVMERIKMRRSLKFYRGYISKSNLELSSVQQQLAVLESNIDKIIAGR